MKDSKAGKYLTYETEGGDDRRLNMFKSKFNLLYIPYFYVIKKDYLYRAGSFVS